MGSGYIDTRKPFTEIKSEIDKQIIIKSYYIIINYAFKFGKTNKK